MQLNDCLLFLQTELSSLDIWPEIVSPPESTALPTSLEPCKMSTMEQKKEITMKISFNKKVPWHRSSQDIIRKKKKGLLMQITSFARQGSPASMTMLFDVSQELLVFFRSPWAFLQSHLITALRPCHFSDLANSGQLREKERWFIMWKVSGKCEGRTSELEKTHAQYKAALW